MIDLRAELAAAILAVRAELGKVVREAVRAEMESIRLLPDPSELITIGETARLIGKSEPALRRQVERGSFPLQPVRVGRALRFRRLDVVRLASDGERL